MTTFRRILTLLTLAAFCAWPSLVMACEGCKSSAQAAGSPNAIGEAFGYSIYFMLAVPTLIMFGLIRMIIRRCRAIDEERARLVAPPVPAPREDRLPGFGQPMPAR